MSRTTTAVEFPIRLILSSTWLDGNRAGMQIVYEHGDGRAALECIANLYYYSKIRFIDTGPSVIVFDKIEETREEDVFAKRQVTTRSSELREIRIRRDFQTQAK